MNSHDHLPQPSELGLFALALGLGGASSSDVLQALEQGYRNVQDLTACDLTELPANAVDFYTTCGIQLIDAAAGRGLVKVQLPLGWRVQPENSCHYALLDEHNRKRAHLWMNLSAWDYSVRCRPEARFRIWTGAALDPPGCLLGGDHYYNIHVNRVARILDRTVPYPQTPYVEWESRCRKPEEQRLATLADPQFLQIHGNQPTEEATLGWSRERLDAEHRAEATAWLNEHYPDWENPAAYWEKSRS